MILKDLQENGKEILHGLMDKAPAIFPKRARRVRWANALPNEMAKRLRSTDGELFSALGVGCDIFLGEQGKRWDQEQGFGLIRDGIFYTEYMPQDIREYYGIDEMTSLKVQSLNINNQPRDRVTKFIKGI